MKTEKGAEAVLTFSQDTVHKERIAKTYRVPELDDKLRRLRNRKEAKILAAAPVRVPKLISSDEYSITMERIHGPRLRDVLTTENATAFGAQLGDMIHRLHTKELIHGDLTTSNVLVEQEKTLVLIDFGLATNSKRLEDRAVDLHVLRETLEGTHVNVAQSFWGAFTKAYADIPVLKTLEEVESRGRYKEKY
jgi:Kae1-associated kinase Bud32